MTRDTALGWVCYGIALAAGLSIAAMLASGHLRLADAVWLRRGIAVTAGFAAVAVGVLSCIVAVVPAGAR